MEIIKPIVVAIILYAFWLAVKALMPFVVIAALIAGGWYCYKRFYRQ